MVSNARSGCGETDSYHKSKPKLLPKGEVEAVIPASSFDSNNMLREYKRCSDDVGCLESSAHSIANFRLDSSQLQCKRKLNLGEPQMTLMKGVKRARVFHHQTSMGVGMNSDVFFDSGRNLSHNRPKVADGFTDDDCVVICTNAPT